MFRFPYILFNEDNTGGGAGSGESTAVVADASTNGNVEATKLQEKITALESNSQKLVNEKRELEGKLKAISDSESIKKGETKKLLDEKTAELTVKENELLIVKAKADAFDNYVIGKREALKKELPDEDTKAIFDSIQDLDKQELYVKKMTAKAGALDTDSGSKASNIKLTEAQKKEAQQMFPIYDAAKAESEYILVQSKIKKKD